VGGIPKNQITRVERRLPTAFKTVYVPIWDPDKGGDGSDVEPVDADTYRRKID
jgi:hypothetical protein